MGGRKDRGGQFDHTHGIRHWVVSVRCETYYGILAHCQVRSYGICDNERDRCLRLLNDIYVTFLACEK